MVNLGAAAASLFALGYGRHEESPERILPFYPAFLAGMNLVVLADDAFTFLVAWEFMSLSSCALVMAHHRDPENIRAGYIYLVMAGIGTLALLLAFGALAGPRRRLFLRGDPRDLAVRRRSRRSRSASRCSAPAPRPGSCRCMSGCRSLIRPRRATSRR